MTTPLQAEQIILNHWLTNWVSGGSKRTSTAFEEESKPSDVEIGVSSWAHLYVQDVDSYQLSHGVDGARKFLRKAQVVIDIFTPQNQGIASALDLAHLARTVFEGQDVSPLKNFIGADIVRVGPKPPEYQISVICPFEYVEVK